MPNLSIKNVPDDVVARLRERAAANHRSLQGELMALVCRASERASLALPRQAGRGTKTIEEIAAAHRERFKSPADQGERAVDMIRADRDAR